MADRRTQWFKLFVSVATLLLLVGQIQTGNGQPPPGPPQQPPPGVQPPSGAPQPPPNVPPPPGAPKQHHPSANPAVMDPAHEQPPPGTEQMAPSTGLIGKIEKRRGRPLSPPQREQMQTAIDKLSDDLQSIQDDFAAEVAQATNVPTESIRKMLPRTGNSGFDKEIAPKIEDLRQRPLSEGELEKIRMANGKKQESRKSIRNRFAKQTEKISGIKAKEIVKMLPKVGM